MESAPPTLEPEMRCPTCGHVDVRDVVYCPQCGYDLTAARRERHLAPWRLIHVGQSEADVKDCLGPPEAIEVNTALDHTHWYYSPHKMSGPRVQFDRLERSVSFWREPE